MNWARRIINKTTLSLFFVAFIFFSCGIVYGKEGFEITKIGKPTTKNIYIRGEKGTLPGKVVEVRVKNHDKDWSGRIRITMIVYDRDKKMVEKTAIFWIEPDDTKYFDSSARSVKGKKQVSFWHRFTEGFFDRHRAKYYEVNIHCDGERHDRKTNPASFLGYLEEHGIDFTEDVDSSRKRQSMRRRQLSASTREQESNLKPNSGPQKIICVSSKTCAKVSRSTSFFWVEQKKPS